MTRADAIHRGKVAVPEGHSDNSLAFQRQDRRRARSSPEGTVEARLGVSRPFGTRYSVPMPPSVKTLGYSRESLRDRKGRNFRKPLSVAAGAARSLERTLLLAFAICLILQPWSVWACAACYGQSDSPLAEGMNWAIISLLVIVGLVLSGVAAFFVYLATRLARLPASDNTLVGKTPS